MIEKNIINGIATLKLNSPGNLNALNEPMLEAIYAELDQCEKEDNVKVIIFAGNGKGFSGGGDIAEMIKGVKSGNFELQGAMEKLKEGLKGQA